MQKQFIEEFRLVLFQIAQRPDKKILVTGSSYLYATVPEWNVHPKDLDIIISCDDVDTKNWLLTLGSVEINNSSSLIETDISIKVKIKTKEINIDVFFETPEKFKLLAEQSLSIRITNPIDPMVKKEILFPPVDYTLFQKFAFNPTKFRDQMFKYFDTVISNSIRPKPAEL